MSLAPSASFLCDQVGALLCSLGDLKMAMALPISLSADAATVDTVTDTALDRAPDTASLAGQFAEGVDAEAVYRQIAQFQQPFHQLLQALAQADLEPAAGQRLRTYQTEAHRRLRLLGVEAMKLRAAKQPMTVARSRSQLQAHVVQLEQFMQAIADEVCSS